ncbi:MAG TPA: NAD(P)/FAD-dependent oxidoreductase [Vicinamibacterales bacterium]|jgi:geranylgeranyl reductase family protein
MHDAIVVGAGPAGLVAARCLARRGLDVAVLEEHSSIGDPVHCTGILAREAFHEFGLSTDTILNELTTARFFSPAGHEVVYRTRVVEAVVIDRAAFDAQLADLAIAAGARLVRDARVTAISREGSWLVVDMYGQPPRRARACVLACGGRYALHRQLGLDVPSLLLHTAQREVAVTRPGDVEVHFGSEAAPRGFAWVVPVWREGTPFARIGVMADDRAPTFFAGMVARIAARWGFDPADVGAPRQKILPLSRISRTFDDRLIVVGDAAGLVKPTTGGGIYYSLLSGTLGADVLADALECNDVSAKRLSEYERAWRARLETELDTQLSFRMVAQRMPDEDIEGLFELARTDGVMPIVRKTASFNRHRKLIVALLKHPPARQMFFRSFL